MNEEPHRRLQLQLRRKSDEYNEYISMDERELNKKAEAKKEKREEYLKN